MHSRERRFALIAAVVAFVVHLVGNPHYGPHRDELYFIICGQHPAWGYVDQPALAPLLAAGSQVFGHSLVALRAVPALFAAGAVYVTGLLALEFGGGMFAAVLAALGVFFAPVLTSAGAKVSADMVGVWLWPLLALCLVRLVKGADPRWWLAAGAALGVCVNAKYTVLFFAVALLLGLLLTPERRILYSRWFLLGAAVAALLALPNFLWQAQHGFPMLEMLHNVKQGKNIILGPVPYVLQQFILTGLLLAFIWAAGLWWLLWRHQWRFLGYAFLLLITMMIVLHAKNYYPANVYPYLFAAGAVAIEQWTHRRRAVQTAIAAATAVVGIAFLPFTVPILSEAQMVAYARGVRSALHASSGWVATDTLPKGELVDDYAGMHGWPELASAVAQAYQSLAPGERARAIIYAQNYGEAGAIAYYGEQYGLPLVVSGHNNYFLWGPQGRDGDVLICVGGNCGGAPQLYTRCERAASFSAPWIQPFEDGIPILVCRGIRRPLAEIWPTLKYFE